MADTTTGISQDNISNQDLQINLEDAPKIERPTTQNGTESHLDLDLNLPDAPKDNDRLKIEDQKNNEIPNISAPIEEIPVNENKGSIETIEQVATPTPVGMPVFEEIPTLSTETKQEDITQPEAVVIPPEVTPIEMPATTEAIDSIKEIQAEETKKEEPSEEAIQPASIVEDILPSSDIIEGNTPEASSLTNDMKMIEALEGNTSAGGLAPEANIPPEPTPIEPTKTFDLDAMLGNPTVVPTVAPVIVEAPQQVPEITIAPTMVAPVTIPTFTIPTTTTQVPVQAISQTQIPHKKNIGVKAFLFVIMFVALGCTTFFILKTMYPIEFANMFSGQSQMHASEITTGTDTTGTDTIATEIPSTDTT